MDDIVLRRYDINYAELYADYATYMHREDPEFLSRQLAGFSRTYEWFRANAHLLNATSFGNAAFVALNSPPPYDGIANVAYYTMVRAHSAYSATFWFGEMRRSLRQFMTRVCAV
jgi:hypothetical protein